MRSIEFRMKEKDSGRWRLEGFRIEENRKFKDR